MYFFHAGEELLSHLVHFRRQRGPVVEHLRDLLEPCFPSRPDGHLDDILLVGVFIVPLRLQGLDLEGEHPLAVVVIGRKRDVAGQVVDDRKQPALLEQKIHQLPVCPHDRESSKSFRVG